MTKTNKQIRVLLTGASGFIGSHLLEYLLKNTNWHFVCPCAWTHKGTPERIINIFNKLKDARSRVDVITHDLNAPFTDRTAFDMGHIDYIINLASWSHVDTSITNPEEFIQNNVNLAINMLELARKKQVELFLQFSTDEVYGVAKKGMNHKEWSPIVPSNPYSASKACQEAIAISYWRTYKIPLMITNTMNVFSENQDWEKFIPLVVKKVLRGDEVQIHSYPGAKKAGSRFYIHADSVASAVYYLIKSSQNMKLKYPDTDLPYRFNIVGDKEVDNLTLAKTIAKILGHELKYRLVDFHSSRPGHDTRYALDGSKLAKFGWSPKKNFDKMLVETIKKLKDRYASEPNF